MQLGNDFNDGVQGVSSGSSCKTIYRVVAVVHINSLAVAIINMVILDHLLLQDE